MDEKECSGIPKMSISNEAGTKDESEGIMPLRQWQEIQELLLSQGS